MVRMRRVVVLFVVLLVVFLGGESRCGERHGDGQRQHGDERLLHCFLISSTFPGEGITCLYLERGRKGIRKISEVIGKTIAALNLDNAAD